MLSNWYGGYDKRTYLENCFAERLQYEMDRRGLEPKDFEELYDISASSIRSYLRFETLPTLETAYKIAIALNVSLDWLCGLNQDQYPKRANIAPWLE